MVSAAPCETIRRVAVPPKPPTHRASGPGGRPTGSRPGPARSAILLATGVTLERSRFLAGAEVGHYWIVDRKIFDLSAYGKFVDNVAQNLGATTVSLGTESITVQGIGESRYGADAGASASLSLSNAARLYVNYDGRYRAALQSHQATVGVELKW